MPDGSLNNASCTSAALTFADSSSRLIVRAGVRMSCVLKEPQSGCISMATTDLPIASIAAAMFSATVVVPTPPFAPMKASTRASCGILDQWRSTA